MVVSTRKLDHTTFYRPQITGEEYLKSNFRWHLKAASYLPHHTKTHADFIIADTAKGSFVVVELKGGQGRVGTREMPSYLQMPVIAGEHHIRLHEMGVHSGAIFEDKGIKTLPELAKVARPIEISYINREYIETLLGSEGKYVLEQVLRVVKDLALGMDWLLDSVEIRHIRDPEVKDWEYVLLLLVFTCDFDTADTHLHELYNQIDMLTGKLSNKEQEVLQRMVFFDIETKASVSSD